jgi:hypothetical protein
MPGRRPGDRFDPLEAAAARTANEEVARMAEPGDDVVAHMQTVRSFRCECGGGDCGDLLELTVCQYSAAVGSRARITSPAHVDAQDEVVERHRRYVVVR